MTEGHWLHTIQNHAAEKYMRVTRKPLNEPTKPQNVATEKLRLHVLRGLQTCLPTSRAYTSKAYPHQHDQTGCHRKLCLSTYKNKLSASVAHIEYVCASKPWRLTLNTKTKERQIQYFLHPIASDRAVCGATCAEVTCVLAIQSPCLTGGALHGCQTAGVPTNGSRWLTLLIGDHWMSQIWWATIVEVECG